MRKIKTLFTLTIALSLVIVIITTNIIASRINRSAIEEESKRLLQTSTQTVALQVENKLQLFEEQIDTLKNTIGIHYSTLTSDNESNMLHILDDFDKVIGEMNESNEEAIASYLVFNHELYPPTTDKDFIYQVVYTKDSNNINSRNYDIGSQSDLRTENPDMVWYYVPIKEKRGVWSNIYFDTNLQQTIVTYSTPIIVENQVIGIVGIDIRFTEFEKIIADIQVYETGYAFLFNEHYDYLVHPDYDYTDNLMTIENGTYAYMKPLFDARTSGNIYYTYKDREKILSYQHLNNNWIIALAPPFEEVFYFYNDLRQTQLYFMLFSSLFALIFAYILGHLISKPITNLAMSLKGTASDKLDNIELKNNHFIYEVDILHNNFNFFIDRLKEAFHTITDQNTNLETLINQRTIDLKESNQQLTDTIKELENTQSLLIKVQKEQEINHLIKNIAHNLNTPLGTAIMTHDYLKRMIDKNETDKIQTTMSIIYQNLMDIKQIIDGLNLLTADHKHTKVTVLSLNTVIRDRIHWLKFQHPEKRIEINFDTENDYQIICNTRMLASLIDLIFNYGLRQAAGLDQMIFDIEVIAGDTTYFIDFYDYQTPLDDMIQFYEQANLNQMDLSKFDLNLHLMHAVIQALNGHITFHFTNEQQVKWIIELPKKAT